ncbi:Bsu YqfO NIF3/CutA domain [Methylomonas albis]|uniref:NGG1p interacting factor NIF3 n=1 Tax=Methylomonas albis TaxID=1854563 RepID=A0ABR9D570_9GAMM|nr:NGG1p interacting factor NIF3 [Methylomonas albis]MBD9358249.1 NGG1p interacting factor NIF3 [Methylomonas albis]CAD6881630.1 Bsu YqfO NIF3/CutA domain [Methylomonas albis]
MYKLSFYVPVSHAEQLKQALFEQGAGRIGDYDNCSWQVLGEGQFRPLAGSEPYLGNIGEIQQVAEYKIEMVCADELIKTVVQTLLACHPYQQPAYEVYKILGVTDLP